MCHNRIVHQLGDCCEVRRGSRIGRRRRRGSNIWRRCCLRAVAYCCVRCMATRGSRRKGKQDSSNSNRLSHTWHRHLLVLLRSADPCDRCAALVTELRVQWQFGAARPTRQSRSGQRTATVLIHVSIVSPSVSGVVMSRCQIRYEVLRPSYVVCFETGVRVPVRSPSWHRVGPRDMPLEAKCSRHVAVAIP
jgi:hypothetical protein